MKRIAIVVLAMALGTPLLPGPSPALAATFVYPGASPCNTTLQACINGVPRGSTIKIRSRVELGTNLTIHKSVTLTSKGDTRKLIEADDNSTVIGISGQADHRVHVRIADLRFKRLQFGVEFLEGNGHSFSFVNSRVVGPPVSTVIFSLEPAVKSSFVLKNNNISGEGRALELDRDSGSGLVRLLAQGNVIRATNPSTSEGAILVDLNAAVKVDSKIYDNVIYGGWSGCTCGFASVVGVRSEPGGEANWTVTGNTVDGSEADGYGIFPNYDAGAFGRVNIFDNIVVRAETPLRVDDGNGSADVDSGFNDFFDNSSPPSYDSDPPVSEFSDDPEFVDRDQGNYRLMSDSELVNKGSHLVRGSIPRVDADREARVEQAVMDVGAYELGTRKNCSIAGTGGPDDLEGTPGRDDICGLAGADTLFGKRERDRLVGGGGGDRVEGGAGPDKHFGGSGPDRLLARDSVEGNDRLDGGRGSDICRADAGDHKTNCP